MEKRLSDLGRNEAGRVCRIETEGSVKKRICDMGLVEGTYVECVGRSPAKDPAAYRIRGAVVAIREADGRDIWVKSEKKPLPVVAVAGNPNVGKSTVFNALTGMKQHTGNWTGKTVENAWGICRYKGGELVLADIPGTYSLTPYSGEEREALEFLCREADAVLVVCDATCLERSLALVLQIKARWDNTVVFVNLMDEAKKKGIEVDIEALRRELKLPVLGVCARKKENIKIMKEFLFERVKRLPSESAREARTAEAGDEKYFFEQAEKIAAKTVKCREGTDKKDRKLDRLLTGKRTGYPLMFLLLVFLLWLTIKGANYPSDFLTGVLFGAERYLLDFFDFIRAPEWVCGLLVRGVYRTLAWVVSVMLPPMAVFFPLFTLLEDVGYLPRIAYNLDRPFQKCRACGKGALTMCMGLGCNAVGVTGCRIIESKRERLIAIITNSFMPCNGRFPLLLTMVTVFFAAGENKGAAAFFLALVILLGIAVTFLTSYLLSATLLKGDSSSFILELPPYRRPQIAKVLVRSVFDRTLFVLGRAAAVAAPAGAVIWILANVSLGDGSLLGALSGFLDYPASLIGLDGVILLAFILGFPANEIVLPIIVMAYLSGGNLQELENLAKLKQLLEANGWTTATAVCVVLFSMFHWPCSTTLLTIKKETGSVKYTLLSALIPTMIGVLFCFIASRFGN